MADEDWERRVARLWATMAEYDEDDFIARMADLAAELPADDPVGPFERGGSLDSTGHPDRAVELYREALRLGLSGSRRRQAVIQLASSLRNLGQADAGVELLTAERAAGTDDLDDAVVAFLALALADTGREREALSLALTALAPHLARYQRSVTNYAALLIDDE